MRTNKNDCPEGLIPDDNFNRIEEDQEDVLIKPGLSENKSGNFNIEHIREERQNTAKNLKQAQIETAIRYAQQEFAL